MTIDSREMYLEGFYANSGPLFELISHITRIYGPHYERYVCSWIIEEDPFGIGDKEIRGMYCDPNKRKQAVLVLHTDSHHDAKKFIDGSYFRINKEKIYLWKVVMRAGSDWYDFHFGIYPAPIILSPWEACTDKYVILGTFRTKHEAYYFKRYLNSKLVRFILYHFANDARTVADAFRYIPTLEFYRDFGDAQIYEDFSIPSHLVDLIEWFVNWGAPDDNEDEIEEEENEDLGEDENEGGRGPIKTPYGYIFGLRPWK